MRLRGRQRNSGISKAAVSALAAVGRSEGMPPPCVRRQKMDHGVEQTPWAIFPSVPGGAAKAAVLFSFKTEITNAREKLLAQQRRREGVYTLKGTGNRAAEASGTFPGGADTRERADSPRTGGWSIADFVSAKRNAGELCFLWFVPKEVPARHEGCRLVPQQKSNPPRLCRVQILSLHIPKGILFLYRS